MKKPPIGVLGVTLALWTALGGAASAQTPPKPTLSSIVEKQFDAWDLDHDGTLSAAEIDSRCVDPEVKGAEAATVAALKRIVRSERYELPALTKAYLMNPPVPGRPPREARPGDGDADDPSIENGAQSADKAAANKPAGPTTRVPSWQGAFRQSLSKIEHSGRELFVSGAAPSIDHVHQGPLGDCYFVSTVGAVVKRDSGAVTSMIAPRAAGEGGGYNVTFAGGRAIVVSPLTDAELALSSTTSDRTGDGGIWLAVLEKAFGTMRLEDRPEKYTMDAATDAIARGGSTRATIRLLTGHTTEVIALRRKPKDPGAAADDPASTPRPARRPRCAGDPPGPSLVLAGDADELAAKVRKGVSAALAANRLVTIGTGDEKLPPGISPRHAYAVLAFDADKDALTIWNPHGNTFPGRGRKMGEPGFENGYPTKAGVFEVPVADVARIFRGVVIETEQVAEKKS